MSPLKNLFAHNEPGPRFKMAQMAELVAEPGADVRQTAVALRNVVQSRLVENRGFVGSGPTAAQIFALADVATAKIMRTLHLAGVTGRDTLETAKLACYSWTPSNQAEAQHHHPITQAIFDVARHIALGKERVWYFRLDMTFPENRRKVDAILYPHDDPVMPTELPAATVLIRLDILDTLARFMIAEAQADAKPKH
jgi:hypothetical protein